MNGISNSVFHYTSIEGLLGILESKCLHASNAFFLSDLSELTHMRAIFVDFIAARSSAKWSKSDTKVYAERMADLLFLPMKRFVEPFVVCFCQAHNELTYHNGLLSQWRGYGDEGGAALEFDKGTLKSIIKKNNALKSGLHMILSSVTYSKSKHLARVKLIAEKVSNKSITAIVDYTTKVLDDKGNAKISDEVVKKFWEYAKDEIDELTTKIAITSCFVKDHSFFEERETRLLALASQSTMRKYRVRDGMVIPYVEILEKDVLPIKRILLGPHRYQDRQKDALENYLRSKKIDIEVSQSSIPYLG